MRRLLFITALLLLGTIPVQAARYAGEFLEIGVGARGTAMGGAMTAHTGEGSSFYWNPAGMSYVQGLQVSGMYADLWEGLADYSVAGVTLPITGAVFSVNWVRLGVSDIEEHPDYDQLMLLPENQRYVVIDGDTSYYNSVQEYLLLTGAAPAGMLSNSESAVFFTFSRLNRWTLDLGWSYFQIPLEMPIGASVKLINHKLGDASASGVGADFGMQIRFRMDDVFYEKWRAKIAWGFNYQDATRTAVDWGEGNEDAIPANFRTGVALIQKLPGSDSEATLSYDSEFRWERTHHFGLEYRYAKTLSVRGGFWGDDWTAGAGISIWRATIDYAYLSRDLGTTHRVSAAFRIR